MKIIYSGDQQKPSTPQELNLFPLIDAFFSEFPMDECTKEIWDLAVANSTRPDSSFPDDASRSNSTFFCANVHALLTGLHIVWDACLKFRQVPPDGSDHYATGQAA